MNKNYIILGATGSVASILCEKLIYDGAIVSAVARNSEELANLKEKLGERLHTAVWDVADGSEALQKIVGDAAALSNGVLDGAVNAIGSIYLKPAHLTSEADFEEVIRVNLFSSFWLAKHCCTLMQRSGGGSLVFFSSVAAQVGLANHEAISAAKGAIEAMIRSLAAGYASKKIRVNGVAPSLTLSKMAQRFNENSLKASEAMHPLKRLGKPEDVAAAAQWLLSDAQSWVTGQILGVDGGLSKLR